MALKPDVIIVHGGWHTPASYSKLTKSLEKDGFTIHIPPLPTMGSKRPPTADLDSDTSLVRDFVTQLSDAGTRSIVLMHSYGGQVGTNALCGLGAATRAAEGKQGGVVQLVYMAAFAMVEGTSLTSWVVSQGHGDLIPLAFDFQDDGVALSRDPKTLLVGADLLPEDEIEEYLGTLTIWASKAWNDGLERCAWREIPVTYIHTAQDMTVLPDYQKLFCEGMRQAGVHVEEKVLDTGHCPNVTAAEEVVDVLKGIAARVTA